MTPTGPDQPPVPRTTPGHVGWHELYAGDWKSAFDFYAGQFGWKKGEAMDMGEMGAYQTFSAGSGEPVGLALFPAELPSVKPKSAVGSVPAEHGQVSCAGLGGWSGPVGLISMKAAP